MGVEWKRVRSLFEQALDIAPDERAALLEAACDGNGELRREVEELLAARERAGNLLAAPTAEIGLMTASTAELEAGDDAPEPDRLLGSLLDDKYRIESLLGRGGMGSVYRATDLDLGREVAIKLIRGEFVMERTLADRFKREAMTVARLRHRHIVSVYDFGLAPGVGMYLVMEYLEGSSLAAEIRRLGRLPTPMAVEIMRQVCSAVDAAHSAGVIHRDLKPENVFLERAGEGFTAKVLDFGIAKRQTDGSPNVERITKTGAVLGTPAYMAPEQGRGYTVDARTDVYALGCVLYEMLAGRPPFDGKAVGDLIVKHATELPSLRPLARPDVPTALVTVVACALAKAPEDRFQTAGALAKAIDCSPSAVRSPQSAAQAVASGSLTSPNADGTGTRFAGDTADGGQPTADSKRRTPSLHNLPPRMTSFIGRRQQLDEIGGRLETARLVTLTGVGGVGKTRLVVEVGREALDVFRDGVWMVELAALRDLTLVPQAVAKALGVREEPGRALDETLADFLKTKEALLVVDNCEHLVDACARLVDRLLRACANLRVLATSREALGVAGETVWPVPALVGSEASRLFMDRAALAKPGFTVTETSAPTIAAICQRLEGIPLAIELAASRVKLLPVEHILERLEDRFRLLTSGSRTAPSRQQTLRAALDWSYELLTEEERALLRQLSVFAGGWTLEAAEQVCIGGSIEADPVLDVLSRLVDKSLVVVEERETDVRYGMLETVREYGRDRLAERSASDEVARRHAGLFLPFGEDDWAPPEDAQVGAWYERLEAERDNVRAALGWSLERDPERCLRAAVVLSIFWYDRGEFTEGRIWLEAARDQARNVPGMVRGAALRKAGHLARRQGDLATAQMFYEEGLRLATEEGDLSEIAWSRISLGVIAVHRCDLPGARTLFEEGLATGREVGDQRLIISAINGLGEVARTAGDWRTARTHYEHAATIARQANLQGHLSVFLENLGAAAREQGDFNMAIAHYAEALVLHRTRKDQDGLAGVLDGLGAVAAAKGVWRQAARLAGAADVVREGVGVELDPTDRADRDRYLADARAAMGEAEFKAAMAEGRALTLEQAVSEALESGNSRREGPTNPHE
jgi:predicted ATPase/serine/threonine protein kinase